MAKNYWFKFEWDAWLGDRALGRCSLETQGFWIRCICLMEEAETWFLEGTIRHIANLLGCGQATVKRCVKELEETNAAEIEKSQLFVKVVSRRLMKRYKLREYNRLKQSQYRKKPNVKSVSNDPSKDIEIKSLRYQEEEKKKETLRVSKEDAPQASPKPKRGTRLPDPFFVTADMRVWAAEKRPGVDLALETEKFCNYWRATPGQKGTKLDWLLTWKNWILNSKANSNGTNQTFAQSGKPTSTDRLAEYGDILSQYPTEAELRNRT